MRISNCKLSYKIIDKIMLSKLHIIKDGQTIEINNITSNELDLLLYLSLRQDPWGKFVKENYIPFVSNIVEGDVFEAIV